MNSNMLRCDYFASTLTSEETAHFLNKDASSIRRACAAGKYPGATKGAGGWLIPVTSLPLAAQRLYYDASKHQTEMIAAAPLPVIAPAAIDADTLHLAYRRAPAKSKARADKLHDAVIEFEDLCAAGESKGNAEKIIKATREIDHVTLWRAREAVAGQPRELWAALLLPRYKGRTKEAELSADAWDWIKSNYLNTSETPAKVIINEAKKLGKSRGWIFPSNKTLLRRINALPGWLYLLGRKGKEAFDATFPAAERDFMAYGVHEEWVTDGTVADVHCLWPDGTIARPFIVAWMDMRSRFICGARGGIHPRQSLTLASLYAALSYVNIKPLSGLMDSGPEYVGKQVSGGQKKRTHNRPELDGMQGALTWLGIKANFARPYRGQAKPIEKFWDYIKNHLDKLPQFQGAYCGKDTASKPEDFNRNNAIPIEIYAAKLAEILAEYNSEHEHSGHGMFNKTPAQVNGELMQAEPYKEWPRPTAEDMRRLCLEQKMRTLNNKDASISLTVEGYGSLRYWSEALTELPGAARAKKYSIFHNPDAPELPILVYDDKRLICEAACISKVGNKEQAKQHCIDKAKFKKPRAEAYKAMKQASPAALPAPVNSCASLPAPLPVVIEKPAKPVAQPELSRLVELAPGVWQDSDNGKIIGKGKPAKQSNEADADALERLRRTQEQRDVERLQKRFGTA